MINYEKRLTILQTKIGDLGLDALLITNQKNIYYLTGIPPLADTKELTALVTRKNVSVLVHSTYAPEAKKHYLGGTILEITAQRKLRDQLLTLFHDQMVTALGFESSDVSVASWERLKTLTPDAVFTPTQNVIESLRQIKDADEIACICEAARITDQAYSFILPKITPGVSEKDLALTIEYYLKEHADGIAFSPIVASGPMSASPHHISGEKKVQSGEAVLLDFGAKINDYCADITRTVHLGNARDKFKEVYSIVLEAQNRSLAYLKQCQQEPVTANNADAVARNYILGEGFPDIPHSVGHSVGLDIHELPRIAPSDTTTLVPGMVFTIEPGIYLPQSFGLRIEDLVVWTNDGPELLTHSPRALLEI